MDTITFAQSASGMLLAKQATVDEGRITKVDPSPQCSRYTFREEKVSGLTSLMRAVWRAAHQGEIAVRAKPKSPTGRRAIYDDSEKGPAGLDVVPRVWVAFDWDGIPLEDAVPPELADDPAELPDPLHDAEIGVQLALRRLPPAFRNVSCGWQISASAGCKPGFRLRTWHWLDHPTTGAELKEWCRPSIERRFVDPVTLVEAQIHYLAVRFRGGSDPCPQRFGIFRQQEEVVAVPDIAGMVRAREQRERAARATRTWQEPISATEYVARRLAECVQAVKDAPDGTKHPTYVEEVARAKALCDRYEADWAPVRDELRDAYMNSLNPSEERRRHKGSTQGVLGWIERRTS